MRIALSNLAWDVAEDAQIAALLNRYEVDAIDIAVSKYFPAPASVSDSDIDGVRRFWTARGVEITGMQALLFGAQGLNLFGDEAARAAMLERLSHVCRIASRLGATRLVFGSFRNRDRGDLKAQQAQDIAVDFFRSLGAVARLHGVVICLEPVPARYGANFMVTTPEAAMVVEAADDPAIRLHLDTGTMAVNAESRDVVTTFAPLIGHVHAGDPDLAPFGGCVAYHAAVASVLRRARPDLIVTVEMLATTDAPHLQSIERALAAAIRCYRDEHAAAG
ncbi:MAG: xylose isomerase [Methylocystis sp.]|nr:MAG: xylose isomerase [Methylocystis sp.]